jgi:hypothetical protein
MLALNGLRVSETIGAGIEALGVERGHRILAIVRKGGKWVTIPLALRIARAIDLASRSAAKGRSSSLPAGAADRLAAVSRRQLAVDVFAVRLDGVYEDVQPLRLNDNALGRSVLLNMVASEPPSRLVPDLPRLA